MSPYRVAPARPKVTLRERAVLRFQRFRTNLGVMLHGEVVCEGSDFFLTALAVFSALLLSYSTLSCGGMTNTAIHSANAAHQVESAAVVIIEDRCTNEYEVAKTAERIAELDSKCLPAAKALSMLRTARLSLNAAIYASQAGQDDAAIAAAIAEMSAAVAAATQTMKILTKEE
jgi:hypothetical protein